MKTIRGRAAVGGMVAAGLLAAGIGIGSRALAQAPETPFEGAGPYPAAVSAAPGLPSHTLYAPKNLAALKGARLPIVAFANGACANDNSHFRPFLTDIASRGYVVVAIGPFSAAPPPPITEPKPGEGPPPGVDPTQSSQLIDAINWAQAESARKGGPLEGRLATDKIAVMGQSCGGLQALDVSPDPRVRTSVILNSGAYNRPGGRSGIKVPKSKLDELHAPIIYLIGGPADIAYPNAIDDFARITKVPAVIANLPVGHSGNYGLPQGGPFAPVAAAWLDWQLKGEAKGRAVFAGPNCGLCGDPAWTIQTKGLR